MIVSQGLNSAPSAFQRMMENLMQGLTITKTVAFLDDLIIFSVTKEEHKGRLFKVLQRLSDAWIEVGPF